MVRRLQAEQEHQQRAFDLYAAQGSRRSHGRVATELGVSLATVRLWSRSFDWSKRVAQRDADQTRKLADRVINDQSDINNRNLKIVRAALLQTAKDISQGKVKPQMGDLERLMRFEEYLTAQRSPTGELFDSDDPDELRDRALRLLKHALHKIPGGREKLMDMLAADDAAQEPTHGSD